jgi:hypothetical protein
MLSKRFYLETHIWGIMVLVLILNSFVIYHENNLFHPRSIALFDIRTHCNSHEEAVIKATEDFKKNKLRIILRSTYEIGQEADKKDNEALAKMEKKYGLTFLHGGCVCCDKYVNTYFQVMKHLINDKYQVMIFKTSDAYFIKLLKEKQPLLSGETFLNDNFR